MNVGCQTYPSLLKYLRLRSQFLAPCRRVAVITFAAISLSVAHAQQTSKLTLGPDANLNYASFSEDFQHAAYVATHGTRQTVYWDGKVGPDFDKVTVASPVLSADGLHCGYTGVRGTDGFVVIDNKEYGPFDSVPVSSQFYRGYGGGNPSNPDSSAYNRTPVQSIVFSPDGKHYGFLAKHASHTVVYEDGKQIAEGGLVIGNSLGFSSRGNHLAFALQDAAQKSVTYYMDGVGGPVFFNGDRPKFTVDGHHLYYVAETAPGTKTFVLDGKPGPEYEAISDVFVSDNGAHFAYAAAQHRQDVMIVIDGKQIPGASYVWLSPDGAHSAYFKPTGRRTNFGFTGGGSIVVDGKEGQNYQSNSDVLFAPDGTPMYEAMANRQHAVVVKGVDSPAYSGVRWPPYFSHDGNHFAYVAADADGSFFVLDGKPTQHFTSIASQPNTMLPRFLDNGSLLYFATVKGKAVIVLNDEILGEGSNGLVSPNGKRVAVLKTTGVGSSQPIAQIVVDGTPGPTVQTIMSMTFSPDSRHFAYVAGSGQLSTNQVYVDGVPHEKIFEPVGLSYSPDSQHLIVRSVVHTSASNDVIYLDDKPILELPATAGYDAIVHWSSNGNQLAVFGKTTDHQLVEVRYGSAASTNGSASDGTVDRAEIPRILGEGNRDTFNGGGSPATASRASAPSSAGGATNPVGVSAASRNPSTSLNLPSGTKISVRLVDAVNSQHPNQSSRYKGMLASDISAEGQSAATGSLVELLLVHQNNKWTLNLVSVTLNGTASPLGTNQMDESEGTVARARETVSSIASGLGGLRSLIPKVSKADSTASLPLSLSPGQTVTFTMK